MSVMTCHCWGTTREWWSHGKQRLKRWVLRRLRKMASDGADVTCCGRLFQIRGPATGKARSLTVDSRVRRTISDDRCRGRTQTTSSFGVCWLVEFVGEVRRCYTLPTLVNKESQLVVNPLRCLQPSWWRSGLMCSYLDEENTSWCRRVE